MSQRSDAIRELNDRFRTSMQGGQIFLTQGVDALPHPVRAAVVEKVRTYNDFKPEDDPHGEHDMGFFQLESLRFMWKIDYYDKTMEMGSDDPTDPTKTTRVLTIMLSEEY